MTIRHADGSTSYINDKDLAEKYLMNCMKTSPDGSKVGPADDMGNRAVVACAGLAAHDMLNSLNGKSSHFFGDALKHARGGLPADIVKALARLKRLCNDAKHVWPQPVASVDSAEMSTGCSLNSDDDLKSASTQYITDGCEAFYMGEHLREAFSQTEMPSSSCVEPDKDVMVEPESACNQYSDSVSMSKCVADDSCSSISCVGSSVDEFMHDLDVFRAEWPQKVRTMRVVAANTRDIHHTDVSSSDYLVSQFLHAQGYAIHVESDNSRFEPWVVEEVHHQFYMLADDRYREQFEELEDRFFHTDRGSESEG